MKTILIAAVVSLLTSILCTPLVVAFFRRRGFGQEIRVDGPQSHLVKRGTPTMGGVAIIGSTVVGYVVAHLIIAIRGGGGPNASGLLLLFLMIGLGVVGFLDDFIKIRHQRSLGLRARAKFARPAGRRASCSRILALQFRNKLGLTPASTHLSYVRDIAALGLGVGRVRAPRLPDHRGDLERGEPHRRAGRARRRRRGDGVRRVHADRVPAVPQSVRHRPGRRLLPRARPARPRDRRGVGDGAPASGSCGGTPRRRRSSWATPGRWRSAA